MNKDNVELVKKFNNAAMQKDFKAMEELLHPSYSMKDPMMEISSPEEFLEFMKECPFDCAMENISFVSDGNKVVQTFDVQMKSPVQFRARMCDVLTIEDGKIYSEEMFYDTADFPDEAKEIGEQQLKNAGKEKRNAA